MRLLLALMLVGCSSTWEGTDHDGDGFSIAQGDCYDNPDADLDGHPANLIHPGATETWYDGVDSNCDGLNDYDQDGDGHLIDTYFSDDGTEHGDDCWDGPATPTPADFTALAGFYQPLPQDVHPGVDEVWYDGVDNNCDAASDFDQDGDGHDSTYHHRADGSAGDDCFDALDDTFDNDGGFAPASVNPDAVETWYDGTDANCDELDDFDQDQDGYPISNDCDDLDETRKPDPGVPEIWYDGIDADCSGGSDYDQDGDGHDADTYGGDDCNDDPDLAPTTMEGELYDSDRIHPGASDVAYDGVDSDCLGNNDFDADGDGQTSDTVADTSGHFGTDCSDYVGYIYKGAAETWYNGIDEDCSYTSDYDQDGDGYDAVGYAGGNQDDCDDGNANVSPDEEEDCNTVADDNCDGDTNDVDAAHCTAYFYDGDSDGYGDVADSVCICTAEGHYDVTGTTASTDDCNDAKSTVNPGVTIEDCDTSDDDDCDGSTNEQNGDNCEAWYADADTDGYGAGASQCWCAAHGTYSSTLSTDCDDGEDTVHPGATETCDLVDQDCDGSVDEGTTHYYTDADGDGYGTTASVTCTNAAGRVTVDADCDDADERVYPGAVELCDEQQNDCSAGSWAAVDEEDTVSYEDSTGAWSDVTSAWAAGTSVTPVTINTASSGTYYVCPGTWYVGLKAIGDDIAVYGPYGAAFTTLSRNNVSGSVASVIYAEDSTLDVEGITLTGGKGTVGGPNTYGGGILAKGSSAGATDVTLTDCEVHDNAATYGGGINAFTYSNVTLVNTDVYDNTASGYGGGIYMEKGAVSCTNGGVYSNTATTEGGGLYMTSQASSSFASVTCDWTGNSPDDAAGQNASFTTKNDSSYGASASFTCVGTTGCTP